MADPSGVPVEEPEYQAEHLRDALATDPRVMQPGLEVRVSRGAVLVRGCVPTAATRGAVAEVLAPHLSGRRLVNDVEVTPNPAPDGAEDLI